MRPQPARERANRRWDLAASSPRLCWFCDGSQVPHRFDHHDANMATLDISKNAHLPALVLVLVLLATACGSSDGPVSDEPVETITNTSLAVADVDDRPLTETTTAFAESTAGATSTFVAEVWADNWFALYVNGELVGEDSVPITTERSFNAETIVFEATYPLTVAIEAKDFIETDSGLEYIGESNQQMGDGGIIAQITDTSTGQVVAATSAAWSSLVVHRAPLNTECEKDADPDTTCEFEITEIPADWASTAFDDSAWAAATEWSAAAVDPKGGYDDIDWDPSAHFVWGADLEVDNTVLLRLKVSGD